MPTILITTMTPGELFRDARSRAVAASAEIQRLRGAPLAPGETIHDRALAVAAHAHALAEAFEIMEALIATFDAQERAATNHVSPPSSTEPPGHRGVHQGDDPKTN